MGFVYFIQCGDDVNDTKRGPIKIGHASEALGTVSASAVPTASAAGVIA